MPELDDQATDKLFQMGAEQHDYTYNPAAWEQMENLLDADLRRRFFWYWVAGILAMLALLGLALSFYTGNTNPLAKDADYSGKASLGEVITPVDLEKVNSAKSFKPGEEQSTFKEPVVESTNLVPNTPRTEENSQAEIGRNSGPVDSGTSPIQSVASTSNTELSTDEAKDTEGPRELSDLSVDRPTARDVSKQDGLTITSTTRLYQVETIPQLPLERVISSKVDPIELPTLKVDSVMLRAIGDGESNKDSIQPSQQNSLAVAVAAGIILGRSGADPFAMVQPRLGGELEYRTGKKFAFGAGVYFNEVCYRTSSENYTAKSDFWMEGVKPETVQGECQVLEIPLSVKYYFNGSRKNSFYLSTGTTSYLMLKEDYQYEYGLGAPADARKGWVENNNNQHFFGMAHVNFGFQRPLGKRSALQLESYIHLPLTGVGHGEVRLMSAGMSVKYLFDFRK